MIISVEFTVPTIVQFYCQLIRMHSLAGESKLQRSTGLLNRGLQWKAVNHRFD